MRELLLPLACAAALVGCQPEQVGLEWTVATWNMHDFFNDRRDSPELDHESLTSSTEYRAKLGAAAALLSDLNADVIVLQEIENEQVTAELARAAGYAYHATSAGNDPRGIDLAMLSRHAVSTIVDHSELRLDVNGGAPVRFARSCLEARFQLAAHSLTVLGVHFKAFDDAQSRAKRELEAHKTAELARAAAVSSEQVFIAGDFNAEPGAPELEALRTYESAAATLAPEERWTWSSGASRRLFDDIRSSEMAASVQVSHADPARRFSDHRALGAAYLLK